MGDSEAMKYFYVDPDIGIITIKKMLYPGTRNQYTVSISLALIVLKQFME